MKITRRRVLQVGLAAAAAASAGVGSLFYGRRRRRHVYAGPELVEHLSTTFEYLRPDPAGIERFVKEYLEHHNPAPRQGVLPHMERTFLLSTNYFQAGQPESGPIRFVLLYHPYVNACYNPLRVVARQRDGA